MRQKLQILYGAQQKTWDFTEDGENIITYMLRNFLHVMV